MSPGRGVRRLAGGVSGWMVLAVLVRRRIIITTAACVFRKEENHPDDPKRCPAGQVYLAGYKGCRPMSCPFGRTGAGFCRSTPKCKAGEAYYSKYKGCRPTKCENGRSSAGWCRACTSYTRYYDTEEKTCVERAVPAPGDPSCPAGELWYGFWSGCRPKSCDHGRLDTGFCKPQLPKPTGLKADGDNTSRRERQMGLRTGNEPRELPDDEYQAVITWSRVPDAKTYTLYWAEWNLIRDELSGEKVQRNGPVPRNSHNIQS